ncbi:MAG: hypothetical protein GEU81_11230 [Nitriliruptorales bacterium]|nr:hypothetical protein [Nitriliruptorales bacterium]
MNATLRTVDGRPVLRFERRLAHPPEKVWRAITEPAHLSQWYPFRAVEMDLRVGGTIRFDDGEGTIHEGVVTALDPPRVFAFTEDAGEVLDREGENLLHFELRPDGEGCLVIFTHTFDDRPHAAANAAGWRGCLDALEMVLDGRPVEVANNWVELHEAYIEAFGLNVGSAEVTPDGWRSADRAAGRVRWELSSSPAGARIILTQTGPSALAEQRSAAQAAWQTHIDGLAKQLQGASR